jgi:hypothetical protein
MVNSSTSSAKSAFDAVLAGIPKEIRGRISEAYVEVQQRFVESEFSDKSYDAIGLSAGKFCEAVIRCLQQQLSGVHIPFGTSLKDFASECRKLEQLASTAGPESLRIIIPRALLFAYTIRNKRGIGHVGGDVDANLTDMSAIRATVVWVVCELVRAIWEVMGKKRVLQNSLNFREKTLLILYTANSDGILIEDLFEWVEYSNLSMFKRSVINPLHKERLVEFDKETESVFISPLGLNLVESTLINQPKG